MFFVTLKQFPKSEDDQNGTINYPSVRHNNGRRHQNRDNIQNEDI